MKNILMMPFSNVLWSTFDGEKLILIRANLMISTIYFFYTVCVEISLDAFVTYLLSVRYVNTNIYFLLVLFVLFL